MPQTTTVQLCGCAAKYDACLDDGHEILDNMESCKDKSISLGNHIWCSSNVSILKGVRLEDGCVVGYNSCLLKSFFEPIC